jgi:uncharacterized protein YcaQ
VIKLSKEHARRFLIARHALSPPRALASIDAAIERIGSLQVDPLAVTGLRNHDLVLAARVLDYRPAELERALYERRSLIEVFDKSLCIVPIADLPFHAAEWRRAEKAIKERGGAYHEATRRHGARLLRELERSGPMPSRELGRAGKKVHAGWGVTTEARAALHVLVRTGKVVTVRREGNMRIYDLAERALSKKLLERRVDHASSIRHRVLGRFRAMGLLGLSPTPEVFISTAKARDRARIVADLVAEKTLLAAEISEVGTRYVLASELPLLEQTATGRRRPSAALLAPLDPLIWDRTLLGPLFGIEYKWGVYTPRHLRSGGYYDLPIVYGDEIVGVIEPIFRREAELLRIARLELVKKRSPGMLQAIRAAVAAHARAIGARAVRWK